ncbi:DinB superfamily protein [Pseudarcicella hirudinis]|uniref:DinB superfamily protein n=1 Tax=Pseudarcicella hirudinis TaxID=1079859 RepID=A0A1I5QRX2_9BACT|nr:DinB family protein [Pseudarcicella hirudinis]SFP48586.1 DinB superfamily protein [Pseudarcicella hirudinis]
MTDSLLKTWETSRKLYAEYFDKYSLEQLNKIPAGFNNNLVWNIGHIVVAQQSLIYRLSNLEMNISEDLFNLYKSGSKPTQFVGQVEADELKSLLISLIEKTKEDYKAGKFVTFNERLTGTGFLLSTLNDALDFNNYHEGMHLGVMMSIRKFV